jgi:F-type H+-transporting ATPase subunit delta
MSSKNLKIAQPYAEAFLDLATKDSVETIINDLNYLTLTLTSSGDLKKVLSNPLVNTANKKSILKSIFTEKIDNKTLKFLLVLCDRGRIGYLDSIVARAIELAYKTAAIEIVKVTSSITFTTGQQEALISKLKILTGARQIKLEVDVNPTLIGGFVIQIGSKIIDTSLQGQLRQLASYLGTSSI